MKRTVFLMFLLMVLCGCAPELVPPSLGEVSVENYDGKVVSLSGESHTFSVEVEGDDWFAVSPTADTWIIAYEKDDKLFVKVSANNEDKVRESHVDVRGAGEVVRLNVRQDYFRNLSFVTASNQIGAADGTYRIALSTNIPDSDISIQIEEGCSWIKESEIKDGYLVLAVDANPSEVEAREVKITVSSTVSGEFSDEATVSQRAMTGFPYEIPVGSIDFTKYPVYDVIDEVSGEPVARVAREYLYKYDNAKDVCLVDSVYTVVYAAFKDADRTVIDYSKGMVLETGGEVSWNENITINSAGYEMISHYVGGERTGMPSKVYIPRGSTYPRFEELSPADKANKVSVEIVPMILEDKRGDKVDTYPVVKIATQYWLKENLRALRYPDGTLIAQPNNEDTYNKTYPLVKHTGTSTGNQHQDVWVANCSPVLRPMVTVMANSDRYWNSSDKNFESYRLTLGCCYTYTALIGALEGLDVSKKSKLNVTKNDAISPEGWRMPMVSDFQKMINYLLQTQSFKNTKEKQEALIEKLCAPEARVPGKNISGFSAHASYVTSAGGRVNSEIVYPTLDYVWASSAHSVQALKLIVGNNSAISNVSIGNAYHVRLIKEE